MKPIATVAAIAIAALSLVPRATATKASAEAELKELVDVMMNAGLEVTGTRTGYLARGELSLAREGPLYFNCKKGRMYVVAVGGCKDAYDLNVGFISSENRRITEVFDKDVAEDRLAELKYVAKEDGRMEVVVQMAKSTANGAHYALVLGEMEYGADPDARMDGGPKAATLDLDTKVDSPDGPVTLRQMMGGKKALYLRLWATWCGPCIKLLPNLKDRSDELARAGIAVAAVENEAWNGGPGGNMAKARATLAKYRVDLPVYVETREQPIFEALNVTGVPHTVVINNKGEILFSDHPLDEKLPQVMKALGIDDFDLYGGLHTE